MKNKIGVNEYKLLEIEREIVNIKLNLIDEYFTFNEENFNFEYLKKLNDFLFSDFYYKEELGTRKMTKEEENLIEFYLRKIIYISINNCKDKQQILKLIQNIWHLQPFTVGNTRTLIAYLKILNSAFLLGLDVDVNQEIASSPSIFNLENFVNQKRLTKNN